MKKIVKLLLLILLLLYNSVNAQDLVPKKPEKRVPLIVQEAFKAKFPDKDPVWFSQYQGRYDNKLVYEGKFIFDNRYSAAVYNRNADLIAFASTIEVSEIPQKAMNYMKNNYPNRAITEALLVSRGEKKATIELGIYIDNQMRVIVFDKIGNFIKSTRG